MQKEDVPESKKTKLLFSNFHIIGAIGFENTLTSGDANADADK